MVLRQKFFHNLSKSQLLVFHCLLLLSVFLDKYKIATIGNTTDKILIHNLHNPIYRIIIHTIYKNETITIQLQETTKYIPIKMRVR